MTSLPNKEESNTGGPVICDNCGIDIGSRSAGYKIDEMILCFKCYDGQKQSNGDVSEGQKQPNKNISEGGFFSFQKMISDDLIKVLYIIGMISIIIIGIVMIGQGSNSRGGGVSIREGGGAIVLGGIALIIFGNVLWRIICEGFILFFSLHETTVSILNELKRK